MTKAAYPILHLLSLDDENDAMTRLLSCYYYWVWVAVLGWLLLVALKKVQDFLQLSIIWSRY